MLKQAQQSFSLYHFRQLLVQHRRKAGIYGLFMVIISLNLCLFLLANMHSSGAENMPAPVQLICFTVMGIVNARFLYGRKFLGGLLLRGARTAFIWLLFILIGLFIFGYYYLSGKNGLTMSLGGCGAFLLPFVFYHGWLEFIAIPEKKYTLWALSPDESLYPAIPLPTVNTILIQICISRNEADRNTNCFPVTASGKQQLGRIFENFIAAQNAVESKHPLDVEDRNHQFYQWAFYAKRWWGLSDRALYPAWTLLQNKLGPSAKIFIKRVRHGQTETFY